VTGRARPSRRRPRPADVTCLGRQPRSVDPPPARWRRRFRPGPGDHQRPGRPLGLLGSGRGRESRLGLVRPGPL